MSYDVTISRQGLSALFDIKARSVQAMIDHAGAHLPPLPERANSKTTLAGADLSLVGRNRWLLRAPIEQEDDLSAALSPAAAPSDVSIVRVSDTLTFFKIEGVDAEQIMAIACPMDLHISVFGPDAVTYTEIFGQKGLVQRCPGGFECAVEQSFGDMVQEYFDRANA